MAISPPSDIVLDVARAVEASDLQAARDRLRAAAADGSGFLDAAKAAADKALPAVRAHIRPDHASEAPESFRKFESMVLQTFIQTMLPNEASEVYGKGIAGEMWKSLLAQRLGDQMAAAGGIGIADRVLGDFYLSSDKRIPVSGIDGDPAGTAERTEQERLSTALLQQVQRLALDTLSGDAARTGGVTAGER